MASTKFDICTTSCYLVGADEVISFDDGTRESQICSRIYETTLNTLLSMHPWVFALKQIELARTTDTPEYDFSYSYQLPSDYLRMIEKDNISNDYKILGDRLYTNHTQVHITYVHNVSEEDLPDYFVRALEFSLAEILAAALAQDESLVGTMNSLKDSAVRTAKNIDSQTRPPSYIQDDAFSLIGARNG